MHLNRTEWNHPLSSKVAIFLMIAVLLFLGTGRLASRVPTALVSSPLQGQGSGEELSLKSFAGGIHKKLSFPAPRLVWDYTNEAQPPHGSSNSFQRKKILITGGAGFIGSQLGYAFHRQGHNVTLLDNMAFGYEDNLEVDGKKFGRLILADVRDPRAAEFVAGVDYIFHFAALSALPVCQSDALSAVDVNVAGTANMLEAARFYGAKRFIFASTSAVYENNDEKVLTEELSVSPHLLYSLSKYQSELLMHSYATVYGLDVVILRFFNVYGPHQDFRRLSPPLTSYLVREVLNHRTPILHSDGNQRRDYVFVDDLIRFATIVSDHPKAKGEIFNVCSGNAVSVNDIYDLILKATSKLRHRDQSTDPGTKISKERTSSAGEGGARKAVYRNASEFWSKYPALYNGALKIRPEILEREVNKFTVGSFAKAQRLLGWSPNVSMEEGLYRMVEFVFSKQGDLQKGSLTGSW